MEIQRLIGRALRSVVDFSKLGERTIWLDCDVLQADGGTRSASITGAFIALADALRKIEGVDVGVKEYLAAVSVGIVNGEVLLDLDYGEDSTAEVDFNVVMTGSGKIVEVQGTGEQNPFTREELLQLLDLLFIPTSPLNFSSQFLDYLTVNSINRFLEFGPHCLSP